MTSFAQQGRAMNKNGENGYPHWAMNINGTPALAVHSSEWADILEEVSGTELEMRLILKKAVAMNETSIEMAPVLNGIFLNWMNLELVSLIARLGMETAKLNKKVDVSIREMRQAIDVLKRV
jgi:hypothetical protein